MTKIFCDVCGEKIDKSEPIAGDNYMLFKIAKIEDICRHCMDAAKALNWPDCILAAARRASPRVPQAGEA